ncbi:hypothetical protein RvY_02932 [Ramazzottius varieornatus]|uniref:RNA polymerase II subunit B1 CTD phosphatase RPAP2 homolog n=1 Tax=Ramazzottius varieornatus TaxID=947166 RepID=A0A1D1ULC7_RAMVA|nr:hypothetical protein RvY_02932 [Ramazzottius varieornatus]
MSENGSAQEKSQKSAKSTPKPKPKDPLLEKRKQELKQCADERVAAEKRAYQTVLALIENPVSEDALQQAAKYIDPGHYNDVTEERALEKLCGYPLCSNSIVGSNSKKVTSPVSRNAHFRIDCFSNKVYDVTERKKYCSGKCYGASIFYQKQLSTTPVWLRKGEKLDEVELIPLDKIRGVPGLPVSIDDPVQTALLDEVKAMKLGESERETIHSDK